MARRNEKPTRKERKKARKELAALLKRLQRGCKTVDQASEWVEMAADVESVINANYRAIPAGHRQRVLAALALPEAPLGGFANACRVLQAEVGKTAAAVGGGSLIGAVAAVVLITAAVVLGATIIASQTAVDLHIFNHGCGSINAGDIPFADSEILALIGLDLPAEVIASGGEAVVSVPPLQFEADNAANPRMLTIYGPGRVQVASFPVERAREILFDGRSLLGTRQPIDLSGADEHFLEIVCGG